jgi:hypothetical protein
MGFAGFRLVDGGEAGRGQVGPAGQVGLIRSGFLTVRLGEGASIRVIGLMGLMLLLMR